MNQLKDTYKNKIKITQKSNKIHISQILLLHKI